MEFKIWPKECSYPQVPSEVAQQFRIHTPKHQKLQSYWLMNDKGVR